MGPRVTWQRRALLGALVASSFVVGFVMMRARLIATTELPGGPSAVRPRAGTEFLAIFVGSSTCGACQYPGLREALDQIRETLREEVERQNKLFISVGVSLDQSPWVGTEFLEGFGPFDEILSGGGWMNVGSISFIVRDFPSQRSIPQLILMERDVKLDGGSILSVDDRLVGRKIGAGGIVNYATILLSSSPTVASPDIASR